MVRLEIGARGGVTAGISTREALGINIEAELVSQSAAPTMEHFHWLSFSYSNSHIQPADTFLLRVFKYITPPSKPPRSTSARLPTELYRSIISFLPSDMKVYPLLFVNSAFHAEAERRLYTNITLAGNLWGDKYEHMQRRMRLFDLLARNPRLSRTVHSFILHPFIYKGELANFETRTRYWRGLNAALREMPNLKEFAMGRLAGENQYPVEGLESQSINSVFSGCIFRLQKLTIFQGDFQNVKVLEFGVVGQDIEELCVPYQISMMFDGSIGLPRLAVLEVLWPFNRIPSLLAPPRKLKALSWRVREAELWQPQTYPELCSLKIEPLRQSAIDFAGLVVMFPSLRFLQIDFPDELSEEMTRLSLPALIHLRKITFGGKPTRSWRSFELCRQIAEQLLENNPHIQAACVGVEEWNKDRLIIGQPRLCEDPNEWKDRKWWS